MSAFDAVTEKVPAGTELRTPDKSSGKPFSIESIDAEAVSVRTARGGRVKISLFTFDTAMKFIEDMGTDWLLVKDEMFQSVLNMENDRVRASSYVISILGAAGLIEVDGSRPNRVRITPQA
jgi:hypothetical protein